VYKRDEGTAYVECFAGCDFRDVYKTLGLQPSTNGSSASKKPARVGSTPYVYVDADGNPYRRAERVDYDDGSKAVFQQRWDASSGTWETGVNGSAPPIPYNLPAVIDAVSNSKTVFVVEGEKSADQLNELGFVATTNPEGSGAWSKVADKFADVLAGAKVVVIVDNDEPGHKWAANVRSTLSPAVKAISFAKSKTTGPKDDIEEHLAAGYGIEDLVPFEPTSEADDHVEPERHGSGLRALTIRELRTMARDEASLGWLIAMLWPGMGYGILGADAKAGKTWAGLDMAVSVATGTPWLNKFETSQGPVLYMLAEGGHRNTMLRLDAIAESRHINADDAPLRVLPRSISIGKDEHVDWLRRELDEHPARMVVVDPLYLFVSGATSSLLNDMGEYLGRLQLACQEAQSALVVIHHWNQTGQGTGPNRFTGAGTAEWGRVLGSAAVTSTYRKPNGASEVTLSWEFSGGEIAPMQFDMHRKVWTDDPFDLNAPMHYEVSVESAQIVDTVKSLLTPSARVVLKVLEQKAPSELHALSYADVLSAVVKIPSHEHMAERTVRDALKGLKDKGLVAEIDVAGVTNPNRFHVP
jgi:5S rRNA maturation endonuclease (ribonuclease M5)